MLVLGKRLQRFILLITVGGMLGGVWSVAVAYEAIQVENGGTVTGVVKFVGSVPPPAHIEIAPRNEKNKKVCGTGTRPSEALMVSDTRGIQNAVVFLQDISSGKAPTSKGNSKLVQEKCWFSPHVVLVPAGSTVDLWNRDKVMHNIHTASKLNPIVNKAHPSFKKRLRFKLHQPEMIKVKCDMHTWMRAWFVVTAHPYYALTAADGAFTLTDVPPGAYTLEVWHETLGKQVQQISVEPNGATRVSFEMSQ